MITKEITYILDKINAEPAIKIRKMHQPYQKAVH